MDAIRECFRSDGPIWPLWALSTLALAWLVGRSARRVGLRDARPLAVHEEGTAYAIGFTATLPLFVVIVSLAVESTLIVNAKFGTIYASFAAARARCVWLSARPADVEEKTRLAAVGAMTPFASASEVHAAPPRHPRLELRAAAYSAAYRAYSQGKAPESYLQAKYRYADAATTVVPGLAPRRPDDDVTVEVRYEYPFNVPFLGRLLGHPSTLGGASYAYTIASKSTLSNEGPKNERATLGIDYQSR